MPPSFNCDAVLSGIFCHQKWKIYGYFLKGTAVDWNLLLQNFIFNLLGYE